MSKELAGDEKQQVKRLKPDIEARVPEKQQMVGPDTRAAQVLHLQQRVGNQAVQRLLAQRSGDGSFELDEATAGRINQARSSGQSLDNTVQQHMSQSMGHDFSGVRVHTGGEADELNQQLSAKAFTTGQDIFFKQGTYDPGSSSGKELIAHELTHVVQQSSGQVGGSSGSMTVNPPGDVFEQEADATAKQVVNSGHEASVQMDADETVQREAAPEEDELQMKADETVQREAAPEEDELQMKADEAVQREEAPEVEEEEV
jgi:hypothetical protein